MRAQYLFSLYALGLRGGGVKTPGGGKVARRAATTEIRRYFTLWAVVGSGTFSNILLVVSIFLVKNW